MGVKWATPAHTRGRVDLAGRVLSGDKKKLAERDTELQVLDNWRAAHSFPLNTIQMGLRQKARQVYPWALVAQRLKRVPSAISKLRRFPRMRLSRMQDIGGCRAVVRSVGEVRRLRAGYRRSAAKHLLVNEKDYILKPKDSGYRGIHLVYRFASAKHPAYNGLLIEIQLRSRLQHAWATAVETVGTFLRQALKASEGEEKWLEFFRLAGSAFAWAEKTPPVPDTPSSPKELRKRLLRLQRELDVRRTLEAYGAAIQFTQELERPHIRYFLLKLDAYDKALHIQGYTRENLEQATADYLETERQLSLFPASQTVLVAAESLRALRKSYPNYFLDTRVFLSQLARILRLLDGAPKHKGLRTTRLRSRTRVRS